MLQKAFSKFVIFGPVVMRGKEPSFKPQYLLNREQKDFQHLVFKNILLPFEKRDKVCGELQSDQFCY